MDFCSDFGVGSFSKTKQISRTNIAKLVADPRSLERPGNMYFRSKGGNAKVGWPQRCQFLLTGMSMPEVSPKQLEMMEFGENSTRVQSIMKNKGVRLQCQKEILKGRVDSN